MTEQGVFTRFGAYDFTSDDRFQSGLDKLKEKHKDKVDASWLLKTKLFYYNKYIEPICIQDYLSADEEKDLSPQSDVLNSLTEDVSSCCLKSNTSGPTDALVDCATSSNIGTHLAEICKSAVKDKADDVSLSQNCNNHVKTHDVQKVPHSRQLGDECSHDSSVVTSDEIVTDVPKRQVTLSSDAESEVSCNKNLTNINVAIQKQDNDEREPYLTFAQIMDYIQRGEKIPGLKDLDIKPTNLQPTESVITRKKKPWEDTIIQ